MKVIEFTGVLTENGWVMPAFVTLDREGRVVEITARPPEGEFTAEKVEGYAIPGFQNAHSHAFQYAMAGTAERHIYPDDFWSWREKMYQLALSISPEEMEAVATMLYTEMLRNGYTAVAEFHYLHHERDGIHYDNLSEMGERLIAAAANAGIRITLIPMFYQKGGLGQLPTAGQRRFISPDTDAYFDLVEASRHSLRFYHRASLGVGVHSIRAVEGESICRTVADTDPNLPFHLHVSEQKKEVADCLDFYGLRPVEWLMENLPLSPRFHLVHATHLAENEIAGIAGSGAQVVLCPSTEGNLGDGRFSLVEFQSLGGKWSVGTDSHIGLSLPEELRILDYGQRIYHHRRNIFHSPQNPDGGRYGLEQMWRNGWKAMGQSDSVWFGAGEEFDAVVLDKNHPLVGNCSPENLLSTLIYAGDSSTFLGTMVAGEWVIYEGKHHRLPEIKTRFSQAIRSLNNR
ncbi:MAG: formimidoylglutamate deiminase [Bacteroidia bacterium]